MKNKIKYLLLALGLMTILGITGLAAPQTAAHPRPARRAFVYVPIRPYYYYDPFWYDPFWYGAPVYTAPRYVHGTIKTEIEPKNAEVYVNGGYAGTANKFRGVFHGLDLRPGNYNLEFRAPGYAPVKMNVYVAADKTVKIKERLRPLGLR